MSNEDLRREDSRLKNDLKLIEEAMQGLMQNPDEDILALTEKGVAHFAYKQADAMLKEREVGDDN